MKRIAVILFFGCLLLCLYGKAQTVTLSVKEAKLESVLKKIYKQTKYAFFYNESILGKAKPVTLDLKNVSLNEALATCFAQQPLLEYQLIENTNAVTVSVKNTAVPTDGTPHNTVTTPVAGRTVKGLVFNKRLEALANASVMVRGTQKGTLTKADGSFTLDNLLEEDVLKISYIGYKVSELPVKSWESVSKSIILEDAVNQLDEVVAKGYSKTTQRLATTSVAKVTGEEIARQPVMNPLMALQGKVPGLLVTPGSNYAAGTVKMEIRGRSILSGASGNPLIIIDGTPMMVGASNGNGDGDGPVQGYGAWMNPAGGQSALFGLNPKDIESIEILKDIGATAIYGSNGANGVILITTKRGKAGMPALNVNINAGFTVITRTWQLLNTPQYLEMRREALKNDGLVPTRENAPDLLIWDTTRNVDWQKELWGRMGTTYNATISLSGGNPQFTHNISANYNRTQELMSNSPTESMGVLLSLGHKSTDQKFSANFSANFTHTRSNAIRAPQLAELPPNAPALYDEAGNLNFQPWFEAGLDDKLYNTVGSMLQSNDSRTHLLSSNLTLRYQIMKGLSFSTSLGYILSLNDYTNLNPIAAKNPKYSPMGDAFFGKSFSNTASIEPQLNYETWLAGKGSFKLTVGSTYKFQKSDNISIMAGGYSDDALLRSLSFAGYRTDYNFYSPYKYAGVFGAMEFAWDNKYVLSMNGRRDGSSRFGPGNRYGNFGGIGLGWIASDEPWLQKVLDPVISFLKLYGNTATAGMDGGGDYEYLTQWGRPMGLLNYDGKLPLASMQAVNPDYHWSLVKELNLGVDIRFFRDSKLGLQFNIYRRRGGDQLMDIPTPALTGFPLVFGNWAAVVQNQGWELVLNATVLQQKSFSWKASVNGGYNDDQLYRFPGIENTNYYKSHLIGRSANSKYILHYLGVDPLTGKYQFEDYNKDGIITRYATGLAPLSGITDNRYIVVERPLLAGGMSHDINYKNFSLRLSFDYRIQQGRNAFSSGPVPGQIGNIPAEIFNNRWQRPGDIAKYGKFTTNFDQQYARDASSMGYTDASFLRFNNISFGYNFPDRLLKRLKMSSGQFNINSNNLFIITRYEGIDPLILQFGMPPVRTITCGFSFTF